MDSSPARVSRSAGPSRAGDPERMNSLLVRQSKSLAVASVAEIDPYVVWSQPRARMLAASHSGTELRKRRPRP